MKNKKKLNFFAEIRRASESLKLKELGSFSACSPNPEKHYTR